MFFARREQIVLAALLALVLVATGLVWWQRNTAGSEPAEAAVADEGPAPDGAGVRTSGTPAGGGAGADAPAEAGGLRRREAGAGDAGERGGGDAGERGGGEAAPPRDVVVHVAGAVRAPGVYVLKEGQRVNDALAAAGGPAAGARPDLLNLAARLEDGQRIHIPSEKDARAWLAAGWQAGDPAPAPWAGGGQMGAGPGRGAGEGGGALGDRPAKVNLNRADAAALDTLPGVGPALAARIIAHRQAHGPFRRVEDLQEVSGIGPSKFRDLRDRVTVD